MKLAFIISIIIFTVLDIFWIANIIGPIYIEQLSDILVTNDINIFTPRIFPSLVAYTVLIFSLWYLVIIKYHDKSTIIIAKEGFIVGSCLYATYALTCLSIFSNFNWQLALMDIIWGGFLFSTTATITCNIINRKKNIF